MTAAPPPPPGLGASLNQSAAVLSGIGDTLHLFATCFERVGISPEEMIDKLGRLIDQVAEEPERGLVPQALRSMLVARYLKDHPPALKVIAGGKSGSRRGCPGRPAGGAR